MKLSFHGGAREVTGACFLFETAKTRFLIDCGLFQGSEECTEHNFEPFRFDPTKLNALLVTHAHLDHIGRIPKLVREGFQGKIYSTPATRDLAKLILKDALAVSRRKDEELYTEADLEKTRTSWEVAPYGEVQTLGDLKFQFSNAGHILGSALVELWLDGKHFLVTGDLGNVPSVLLPPPEAVHDVEYLVIESTYGSRTHESPEERVRTLERTIEDTAARGGTLLIPAFATERTQDILFLLNEMLLFKRIPELPVFVDSPLAIKATSVYASYPGEYKPEVQELYRQHPHLFQSKKLRFTETVEESKHINEVPPPKVVIAGSGMMQGGRILHHAKRYLSDPKTIILITGYQAAGSLGRRLIDKEREVRILGEDVAVRAEVRKINGFSAHADNPQLFSFVESAKDTLRQVFVVQGEEASALHLTQEVRDRLGLEAAAPVLHQEFTV